MPSALQTDVETSRPLITFVIPALNEEDVIVRVVGDVVGELDALRLDYEIVLIDDGSRDRTGALMDELAAANERIRVIHNGRNVGLGESYKRGLAEARGDYLMMLCGDGGFPAASLPLVLAQLGTADILVPYMLNLARIKTPLRLILSRTYTTLLNVLFGQRIRYYNGLPVHKTANLRSLEIKSSGFGFQAEILIKLIRSGCDYKQIGVLGAEETKRSNALRLRNVVSVGRTLARLVVEVMRFKPASGRKT
jgi:glycosyltransferase involved in cell wall biosynthesis